MEHVDESTIARIPLARTCPVNFAHVVGELERALGQNAMVRHSFSWHDDDMAVFDFRSTRIVLAIAHVPEDSCEFGSVLTVSVGTPADFRATTRLDGDYEVLCSQIVERICNRYAAGTVIWQQINAPMTVRALERVQMDMPSDPTVRALQSMPERPNRRRRDPAAEPTRPRKMRVDRRPKTESRRLLDAREALYRGLDAEKRARPTLQGRLAVAAIDGTVALVCPPAGAAMLTYHAFKGSELRRCSQMLILTGFYLGATKGAMAQGLLAFL